MFQPKFPQLDPSTVRSYFELIYSCAASGEIHGTAIVHYLIENYNELFVEIRQERITKGTKKLEKTTSDILKKSLDPSLSRTPSKALLPNTERKVDQHTIALGEIVKQGFLTKKVYTLKLSELT